MGEIIACGAQCCGIGGRRGPVGKGNQTTSTMSKVWCTVFIGPRRPRPLQMIRTIVFSLLAVETALCGSLWIRRREFPITVATMIAVGSLYAALAWIRWQYGFAAYRDAVIATRPCFWLSTAAICVESVRLLSAGVPRQFAIATSAVFFVASAGFAWLSVAAPHAGIAGSLESRTWSTVCVLYVAANYWLYSRRRPDSLAMRHAVGAMLICAATATAFWLFGAGWQASGLVLQRVGGIAALMWWLRKP